LKYGKLEFADDNCNFASLASVAVDDICNIASVASVASVIFMVCFATTPLSTTDTTLD
jgi:hypothetical protein